MDYNSGKSKFTYNRFSADRLADERGGLRSAYISMPISLDRQLHPLAVNDDFLLCVCGKSWTLDFEPTFRWAEKKGRKKKDSACGMTSKILCL